MNDPTLIIMQTIGAILCVIAFVCAIYFKQIMEWIKKKRGI